MGNGVPDFLKDEITRLVKEHGGTFVYRDENGARIIVKDGSKVAEATSGVMRNPELVEAMVKALVVAMMDGGFSITALREMSELFKDAATQLDAFRTRMEAAQ